MIFKNMRLFEAFRNKVDNLEFRMLIYDQREISLRKAGPYVYANMDAEDELRMRYVLWEKGLDSDNVIYKTSN